MAIVSDRFSAGGGHDPAFMYTALYFIYSAANDLSFTFFLVTMDKKLSALYKQNSVNDFFNIKFILFGAMVL